MIKDASELLQQFMAAERRVVDGIPMDHMPTLGSAYEAIVKEGINQKFVIPNGIGLTVVSGFVSVGGTMLKQQLDCMLVDGEGTRYGRTEQFIYPIEQVLCILEVKKTLGKGDLLDAMDHLGAIKRAASDFLGTLIEEGRLTADLSALRIHYSQISGLVAPASVAEINRMEPEQGILFHSLLVDHLAPAMVILGFDGYRTEEGLREAFISILESRVGAGGGFGIPSLPSLVLASEFSLVKANGMPYICKWPDSDWMAVASVRSNPARMLLEIIWTKIGLHYGIAMPWNDGLDMENLYPLLTASPHVQEDAAGWRYELFERKEKTLRVRPDVIWRPAVMSATAMTTLNLLMFRGGFVRSDDEDLNGYLQGKHGQTLEVVLAELIGTGYFMREGRFVRPIHPATMMLKLDDGTGYMAHDREKFDAWCTANDLPPPCMTLIFVEHHE